MTRSAAPAITNSYTLSSHAASGAPARQATLGAALKRLPAHGRREAQHRDWRSPPCWSARCPACSVPSSSAALSTRTSRTGISTVCCDGPLILLGDLPVSAWFRATSRLSDGTRRPASALQSAQHPFHKAAAAAGRISSTRTKPAISYPGINNDTDKLNQFFCAGADAVCRQPLLHDWRGDLHLGANLRLGLAALAPAARRPGRDAAHFRLGQAQEPRRTCSRSEA